MNGLWETRALGSAARPTYKSICPKSSPRVPLGESQHFRVSQASSMCFLSFGSPDLLPVWVHFRYFTNSNCSIFLGLCYFQPFLSFFRTARSCGSYKYQIITAHLYWDLCVLACRFFLLLLTKMTTSFRIFLNFIFKYNLENIIEKAQAEQGRDSQGLGLPDLEYSTYF